MELEVEVTEQDISKGVPGSSLQCPLARAIQRASNHPFWTVGLNSAVKRDLMANRIGYAHFLPPVALKFRRDFDASRLVKPFTFSLEV